MSVTVRVVEASPEKCWSILSDGWLYPLWVVGATRMRDVDDTWPAPGSRLHHSSGVWPLVVDDTTEVRACEEAHRLQLRARGWPAGEADVDIRLRATGGGRSTEITLEETASAGPGSLVPEPVENVLLGWRNTESLLRLALLIEGR